MITLRAASVKRTSCIVAALLNVSLMLNYPGAHLRADGIVGLPQSPIRHRSNHSGNEGHCALPQGGVQVSTSDTVAWGDVHPRAASLDVPRLAQVGGFDA
jgi:hypothetical protein